MINVDTVSNDKYKTRIKYKSSKIGSETNIIDNISFRGNRFITDVFKNLATNFNWNKTTPKLLKIEIVVIT